MVVLAVGCGGEPDAPVEAGTGRDAGSFGPTAPYLLATSAAKDEDPTVVRAADGRFYVAFYSNRNGPDQIFVKSSDDGQSWSADRAITGDSEHAFYPSLSQTRDGRFHLVWFRGSLSSTGATVASIWTMASDDSVDWSAPVALSNPTADAWAWAPTIAERVSGEIWVAWSSDESGDKDVYLTASHDGGQSWGAPIHRADPAFNDDLPFIAAGADGSLVLLWQRFDVAVTDPSAPFSDASNELVYATSFDGATWSEPIAITDDPTSPIPDVIGALYPSADPSGWSAAWSSVRGSSKDGDVFTVGLGDVPVTASNITQLTDGSGADYSARLVSVGAPNLYFMVWVSDRSPLPDGSLNHEIFAQFIER